MALEYKCKSMPMGRYANMAQLHSINLVLTEEAKDFTSLCEAVAHRTDPGAANLATGN